jgi:hypothetical protein
MLQFRKNELSREHFVIVWRLCRATVWLNRLNDPVYYTVNPHRFREFSFICWSEVFFRCQLYLRWEMLIHDS